jgi:hypothetical protein
MSNSEHKFQDVKRLLKLKRHEAPPPGYFNNFSSEVISRIREGETSAVVPLSEKLTGNSWFHNLLHMFDARPGMIGGLATSVCLLVVFGLVLTEHTDNASTSFTAGSQMPQVFAASTQAAPASAPLSDPLASSGITLSTNPVTSLQPVATLFGQPNSASLFQPAGFSTSGH